MQETFELNNAPASAPMLTAGSLYLSYITSAADTDFYRFAVPATGTRTTIRLGHLPADYDLVVYGPAGSQLVSGTATRSRRQCSATPALRSRISRSASVRDARHPLAADRPARARVSAFRTTEDDSVVVISDGSPGDYVVQVTGYNGASSVDPYMLRVETEAPRLAPTCQARPTVSFGTGTGVSLAGIPTDTDTLFLVNGPQLATLTPGGQTVLDWFTTAHLNSLRTTGHPSALVRLENDPVVRPAYTAWNAQPCSPIRANAVVRSITDVIATIRAARPSVRNVVLLGADRVLPFARIDDLTTVANEVDYASTFGRANEPYGALFEHKLLSDDPYGTTQAIPYLQRRLFVPQLAVGRLVETPAQITGALDRFLAFGGVLDPTSARTSGYDFLSNGASGVAAAFSAITRVQEPATNPPLIGNLWTKATLAGALGTTTGLIGMNGHADHRRLQPARDADGDGRFLDTDLFTAADLPGSLQRAVVFSMDATPASRRPTRPSARRSRPTGRRPSPARARGGIRGQPRLRVRRHRDRCVLGGAERRPRAGPSRWPADRHGARGREAVVPRRSGVVRCLRRKGDGRACALRLPMWALRAPAAGAAAPTGGAQAAGAAVDATEAAALAGDPPAGVTRLSTDLPITGLPVDHWQSQPMLTQRLVTNPNGGRYWEGPERCGR